MLNIITDNEGAVKSRMRIGRGIGSGKGKTGGRGVKGQKARSGVSIKGFEGGQMPLHRRLPKRGFNKPNKVHLVEITLERLQAAINSGKLKAGDTVDTAKLLATGLIRRARDGVRVVGTGTLNAALHLKVYGASSGAVSAVEANGGSINVDVLSAKVKAPKRSDVAGSTGNDRPAKPVKAAKVAAPAPQQVAKPAKVAAPKPVAAAEPVKAVAPAPVVEVEDDGIPAEQLAALEAVKVDVPKDLVELPKVEGQDKFEGARPLGLLGGRNGGKGDNLQWIKGIGKQNEERLHALGIWHFDQIASWSKANILWTGGYLAFPGRIDREQWVVQAKYFATGGQPVKKTSARSTAPKAAKATGGGRDSTNLSLIAGIGPTIEKKLRDAGIQNWEQIASWSDADLAKWNDKLELRNRAVREEWVEQAKELLAGKPPRAKADQKELASGKDY